MTDSNQEEVGGMNQKVREDEKKEDVKNQGKAEQGTCLTVSEAMKNLDGWLEVMFGMDSCQFLFGGLAILVAFIGGILALGHFLCKEKE